MLGDEERGKRRFSATLMWVLPLMLIGTSQNAEANGPMLDALVAVDLQVVADGRSREWIEFEFYRDSRIFLPLTVNGHETVGVLDSGAGLTVIDASVAKAAGIEGSSQATGVGTGGDTQIQLAHGVSLRVGDVELRDLTVAIMDLSDVADRLLGRPLPVILGADVFNARVVDIDYPNQRIAFHDPDSWYYEGLGEVLPLTSRGAIRYVEIRVEGGEPIKAGFDIGQGGAVTILKSHADETNLLEGRPSGTARSGGVGGATTGRVISLDSVVLGDTRFTNVPTLVMTEAVGAFDTDQMQANVGTGIYSRFRMIVDYARDRLILEPNDATTTGPFRRNRAGAYVQRTTRGLEIVHISESSPAAEAGMGVGDIVTEIDGTAVDDNYWMSDMWRWTASPAGTRVDVTIASGRTFSFRLQDYY